MRGTRVGPRREDAPGARAVRAGDQAQHKGRGVQCFRALHHLRQPGRVAAHGYVAGQQGRTERRADPVRAHQAIDPGHDALSSTPALLLVDDDDGRNNHLDYPR
jgi:hypothetical protein